MRIDAHQHFWQYNQEEYGWISYDMNCLKRDFLPDDLSKILQKNDVEGSIAVQARQTLAETQWLVELADSNDMIKGVVGWVDLCSRDLERQLEWFSQHPKLKGVRHVLHDEPDDRFMLRRDFLKGIGMLKNYGLKYDILIFEKHLPHTIEMVKKFPDQSFVVDHIGKPRIKDQVFSPWRENVQILSGLPNIYCKLSGMITEADWNNWTYDDIIPYMDICLDAFGPDRLMIGSDWPVCTAAGEYSDVIAIVRRFISDLSDQEQDQILGTTCSSFYNI